MTIIVDLRIEDTAWASVSDLEKVCNKAVSETVKRIGLSEPIQVDILLGGDEDLADLNESWRGKSGATDVLSFPADIRDRPFIGDIAIAIGVAMRDADASGKSLRAHLSHLLVHGVLHLVGHDHQNDKDALIMESLERDVMSALGYADPYSRIEQS